MWDVQLFKINYDQKERNAINNVLDSGWIAGGANINLFEKELEKILENRKTLTISNDELSFGTTDLPINEDRECVESEFRGEVQHRIDCLENRIENMPIGHSKLDRAKETVAFLKAIDLDAISYPTTTLDKYLNDNNKYTNYRFI